MANSVNQGWAPGGMGQRLQVVNQHRYPDECNGNFSVDSSWHDVMEQGLTTDVNRI